MNEQEKTFDIVSIVLLMLLALANDALEIFFDILAATGLGIAGQAIMEPLNAFFDGLFTIIFFWKTGFGWSSLIQIIDDCLEPFGIPGRTIAVGGGIWLANNSESKIGKLARLALMAETGALALEGVGALEAVEATEEGIGVGSRIEQNESEEVLNQRGDAESIGSTSSGQGTQRKKTMQRSTRDEEVPEIEEENDEEEERKEELEQMMETSTERNPLENVYEETFENTEVLPNSDAPEDEKMNRIRKLHREAQELPSKLNKRNDSRGVNIDEEAA